PRYLGLSRHALCLAAGILRSVSTRLGLDAGSLCVDPRRLRLRQWLLGLRVRPPRRALRAGRLWAAIFRGQPLLSTDVRDRHAAAAGGAVRRPDIRRLLLRRLLRPALRPARLHAVVRLPLSRPLRRPDVCLLPISLSRSTALGG